MTQSKIASPGLNRATQNLGTLGKPKQFLAYKAKEVGIDHVLQEESYTSRTNCYTGEDLPGMTLAVRSIDVEGEPLDRDVNAAINIAIKNLGGWFPQLEWIRSISVSKRYVVC